MVAIKYAPIAATAFVSFCTGVAGASVLSKRQASLPSFPLPPAVPGLLSSSSPTYGGRAFSHRAAETDPSSAAPANSFGLQGSVPGALVVSQGGHTLVTIPATDVGAVPSNVDVSVLGDLNSNLTALLNSLTSIASVAGQVPGASPLPLPLPLPLPVPAPVPGVPSTDPASALLDQTLGAIQALLPLLGQLPPNTTVPPSASDSLAALLTTLTTLTSLSPGLLGLLGGDIPSSTSGGLDTLGDFIALISALVPVLTSLVSVLQLGGL